MKIAKIDKLDMLNNPGDDKLAFTIWFQGCSAGCHDCHNPELQVHGLGRTMNSGDIMSELLLSEQDNNIRYGSVVLLGGEPLEQPLSELSNLCKIISQMGYKIFLYTGWEFNDIPQKVAKYLYRIKTGKYMSDLRQEGFPASSNQRVYRRVYTGVMSDKGKAYFAQEDIKWEVPAECKLELH